ncbi:MAG: DUF3391 domain-containing protein, partial [Burkholderiaceae bacterium]
MRISVSDVRIGMFIAELDRPWMETPFMLQGFLLKEATHLQMLRDFVSEVMIDPTRSAWSVVILAVGNALAAVGVDRLRETARIVVRPMSARVPA